MAEVEDVAVARVNARLRSVAEVWADGAAEPRLVINAWVEGDVDSRDAVVEAGDVGATEPAGLLVVAAGNVGTSRR